MGFRSTAAAAFCAAAAALSADAQPGGGGVAPIDVDPSVFEDARRPAPGDLPHARIAEADSGDIREAWYAGPTTRYAHGVLGDAIEASELHVRLEDGAAAIALLPETLVFEDVTPRIVDVDGDGRNEVLTITSSLEAGAAIVVYGVEDGRFAQLAASRFIGRRHRWLNIAGALQAPSASGGGLIAAVETPHIGGVLKLWRFERGVPRLSPLAEIGDVSTHAIGSPELRLAWIADFDGDGADEIALPSFNRRRIRILGLDGGEWIEEASADTPRRIDRAILPSDDGRGVVLGLEDGSAVAFRPFGPTD